MPAKQNKWKTKGLILLGLALVLTTASCTTVDKYVQQVKEKLPSWGKKSNSKPAYYRHKVRYSGESLSIIAAWYTGDVENWRYLAKVNPKLDPDHIRIGTKIRIPNNLLRTRKRMPKDFVEATAKRHQTMVTPVARAPTPTKPRPAYYYHKVKYSGETLSLIAKWYTGDMENWRALTKANPKLDPDRIIVGHRIRIPHKLLNTKKPMPRSFVVGFTKRKKSKPSQPESKTTQTAQKELEPTPSSPPPSEPEVFELFGPK